MPPQQDFDMKIKQETTPVVTGYVNPVIDKAHRGLENVFTSPLEIPLAMRGLKRDKGWVAGIFVCLAVEFFDRVARVDDPVGAISVHGVNGLWGVLSVGLFADGRSNYGGSWNGVAGGVTGIFYGDAGQLTAQLIGIATLIGVIFTLSYVFNWLTDVVVGQRVGAKAELAGLDIPEMGALCYPDFQLKAGDGYPSSGATAAAAVAKK